jgi:uncharacterized ParB-like nuclease family protein
VGRPLGKEVNMEKICKNCAHWCICKTWATENGVCAMHDDRKSEGEWVSCDVLPADEDGEWTMYACSVCKHTTDSYYRDVRDLSRYCPNCGAKMKGGAE